MANQGTKWTVKHNCWHTSTVYGPDGEMIAECPIASGVTEETQGECEAEKEANARLIVAAPAMLEALIDALDLIETITPIEGDTVRKIRAAIKLAKGEA